MLSLPSYVLEGSLTPIAPDRWDIPNVGMVQPLQSDQVKAQPPLPFTSWTLDHVNFGDCELLNALFTAVPRTLEDRCVLPLVGFDVLYGHRIELGGGVIAP